MAIRNQNWYNLQSTRRYPLDDISTGVDDAGAFIREDIIVDCNIQFPRSLGQFMYVQGITVSAQLVTVVFGCAENITAAGTTVAAISLVRPVDSYVNYSITGLVPGISGWIVFGPGIETPFSGRYTTTKQTLINPRNAKPYAPLPISSLSKINNQAPLTDIVNLVASDPVTATYELVRNKETNTQHPAIVFRLNQGLITNSPDYNPLSLFLGPCSQRPESGTCPKPPIESINGIQPDCDGNIVIEFPDFPALSFEDCGGLDMLGDVGLVEVCQQLQPKRPKEFTDFCCEPTGENVTTYPNVSEFPPVGESGQLYVDYELNTVYRWENGAYVQTEIVIDEYCWPNPADQIDIFIDETREKEYPCLVLPLCSDFSSCFSNTEFEARAGQFEQTETLAPAVCADCAGNDPVAGLTTHYTAASLSVSGFNIYILRNCATDWAYGRTMSADFKITANGVERNGGIIINYNQEVVLGQTVTTYAAVLVDVMRARVRVVRFNNAQLIEELSVPFNAKTNTWYNLTVAANLNGDNIAISFTATSLDGAESANGIVNITAASIPTGFSGLFAYRSYTYFNKFTIQ